MEELLKKFKKYEPNYIETIRVLSFRKPLPVDKLYELRVF